MLLLACSCSKLRNVVARRRILASQTASTWIISLQMMMREFMPAGRPALPPRATLLRLPYQRNWQIGKKVLCTRIFIKVSIAW